MPTIWVDGIQIINPRITCNHVITCQNHINDIELFLKFSVKNEKQKQTNATELHSG